MPPQLCGAFFLVFFLQKGYNILKFFLFGRGCMENLLRYLRSAAGYLQVCAKWLVLAALVGCAVGPLGGAFGLALNWANATRAAQPWL